jgi:hypothetical protein
MVRQRQHFELRLPRQMQNYQQQRLVQQQKPDR